MKMICHMGTGEFRFSERVQVVRCIHFTQLETSSCITAPANLKKLLKIEAGLQLLREALFPV